MTPDVDHTNPMGAVVADIRLRTIRRERDIERLDEAGNGFDLGEGLHVNNGYRVPFRVALIVPTAVGRKGQVLWSNIDVDHLDQFQRADIDDGCFIDACSTGHDVAS